MRSSKLRVDLAGWVPHRSACRIGTLMVSYPHPASGGLRNGETFGGLSGMWQTGEADGGQSRGLHRDQLQQLRSLPSVGDVSAGGFELSSGRQASVSGTGRNESPIRFAADGHDLRSSVVSVRQAAHRKNSMRDGLPDLNGGGPCLSPIVSGRQPKLI